MSACLYPNAPKAFDHDPGGALLNMGLAATQMWRRAMALPPGDPERAKHLQTAIRMRLTERSGWLAVRTPQFPAGDLAGAAQAALAIGAYHCDDGDLTSARAWVLRAVAEAPAGTAVAMAAAASAREGGW
jgi:hypothetical protein